MDMPHQVSGALDDETFAGPERLAEHFGCSADHLVATAVLRFVNEESRILPADFDDLPACRTPELDRDAVDRASISFDAFIQRGLDDIEAGRAVPHDEVMCQLRERCANRQAAE